MVKTLRPQNYNEVFYVGDWFRCGTPVVMDLNEYEEDDATPLVDFATGLVIGCGGAIERIAPRLFLLLPASMVEAYEESRTPTLVP
ncbi:cell division protein SepF [Cryptosporangium phraense]|uniref:cell division protein SepF n=1 Tax=Cryptosporangium phraense TaxID=2593070 RepID=UPI0014783053|nr:cell division protein SepF [Cryptosporangium phraense]